MKPAGRAYWICQVLGWGIYSCLGLWMATLALGWHLKIGIAYGLFWAYSIALTHVLRGIILRRGWIGLSFPRLLIRLGISSLVLGSVLTALVIIVSTVLTGPSGKGFETTRSTISLVVSTVAACSVWLALYFGITMLQRYQQAQQNELRLQLALREAELRALEAQLSPHFLFNCLNTIRGMVLEDAVQAQDMITKLANILRYNLKRDRTPTAPLSHEIAIVSDYLALEAARFEDRLHVTFDVDEQAAHAPVPTMLLQTLVENALKHGISQLPDGGDVAVKASVEDGHLRIEVRNSGDMAGSRTSGTQIGLQNARERLRVLYGDGASLDLVSLPAGVVAATVLIPRTA